MSLPGLGLEEPNDASFGQGSQTQNFNLKKESELRFEVATGRSVDVKVCLLLVNSHLSQIPHLRLAGERTFN